MKRIVMIASLLILLTSCSKKLIPYTMEIEKGIIGQEDQLYYYISSDLALITTDYQDTLVVNSKGEIERQKSKHSSEFYVKAGSRGSVEKLENGVYWLKFDPDDDRLVPFVLKDKTSDLSNFIHWRKEGTSLTILSDEKVYLFRGVPYLKVSEKVISKIVSDKKIAKGIKIRK